MKIMLVWSSANEDGLTAAAKDRILAGALAGGGETEEIWLNGCRLNHCQACGRGWGNCKTNGSCVQQDDFRGIYEKLCTADAVVFVTAVYWHDLTEQMKAFTDRLRRCETAHNGFLKGKRCILTACAGGSGRGAIECLHNLEEMMNQMQLVTCDRIPVGQYNRSYMLTALEAAGKRLTEA